MVETQFTYAQAKEQHRRLPDNHFWVLGIFGIWGDRLSSREIARVARDINLKPTHQLTFTQTAADRIILDLAQTQWLTQVHGEWMIEPAYREATARVAILHDNKVGHKIIASLQRSQRLSDYVYPMGGYRRSDSPLRVLRLQYLAQDTRYFFSNYSTVLRTCQWQSSWAEYADELPRIFLPYDPEWISSLNAPMQTRSLEEIFHSDEFYQIDQERYLQQILATDSVSDRQAFRLRTLAAHLLLYLHPTDLEEWLPERYTTYSEWQGLVATRLLLADNNELASPHFAAFVKLNKLKQLPENLFTCVYLLWNFRQHQELNAPEILSQLEAVPNKQHTVALLALRALFIFHTGEESEGQEMLSSLNDEYYMNMPDAVVWLWCLRWMGGAISESTLNELEPALKQWEEAGTFWLAGEAAYVLGQIHPQQEARSRYRARAAALSEKLGIRQYIGELLRQQESWERVLKAFERVAKGGASSTTTQSQRVVWFIDFEEQTLLPKEQKWGKNGRWTAGRKIAPTQILYPNLESLTEQDKATADGLRTRYHEEFDRRRQYRNEDLHWNFTQTLYLLAGHPHLFLAGKQQIPVELIRSKPQLFLTETEEGVRLRMEPQAQRDPYVVRQETPTRYRVYHFKSSELQLAKAVGEGADMPTETVGRLESLLDDLQDKVTIHSSLALADSDLPKVEGDASPCLHLLPFKEGLKLQFTVKPLPSENLYFPTGEGIARQVVSTSEGDVICSRDLIAEKEQKALVLQACPILREVEGFNNEWQLEEIEACLQLLLELRPLQETGTITVEYPKGEKIRLLAVNSTGDLSVRVQQERDWFAVDGELRVDEGQVIEFSKLLEHMQQSKSPFVELKPGEFVALTEEFRQRLHEIEGMLQQKGKNWQLSGLAAPALDDLAGELADLEVDAAWRESLARMEKAQRIRPRVPKDFQAELRAYQLDGFRWLSRLAEWGVGACLADDMGLGKTVQALALLSARAKHGPSLVIAPASVARNWIAETNRFAPGLLPHLLETSKEAEWINDLEAGDLLVVSYGLLPFVEELLIAKPFNVIVLDEAQAIKNRATKRSQIVMELQADFRIATTGTPIENHLGELWNLFRFLNPGLLGSQRNFNEKFAKPIQRDNDKIRRDQLRRIIRPFILRRHKSEVLTELPPKTEVTLTVEPTVEELAFYETLRRRALEEIEAAGPPQKRFTVLAQLMRLRQAACHPRLVDPKTRIGSSKLDLVGETVQELLENGHKVLIFSQFVRHLQIIEQWIKSADIRYQYLDGSTPTAKREERIQAFQGGEGDVFLISLKAGGTGLNLTAADYVLHLDPWWNPAVEDQASDRAHRIGQQRPVTVYRFVTEHTVEEKIVALHKEKRDLADQLLSGTDASASLSVDQMLELVKG